jgi:hypothetical protein
MDPARFYPAVLATHAILNMTCPMQTNKREKRGEDRGTSEPQKDKRKSSRK